MGVAYLALMIATISLLVTVMKALFEGDKVRNLLNFPWTTVKGTALEKYIDSKIESLKRERGVKNNA